MDLAQTANKGYWRHFRLDRVVFVSLLCLPHAFGVDLFWRGLVLAWTGLFWTRVWRGLVCLLIIKLFRHPTSYFLKVREV